MTQASINKFIINSDYPIPEKVETSTATVLVGPGTTIPSRTVSTQLNVNDTSQIFRVAFKCSRTGNKIYAAGNNFINLQFNDASYNVYIAAKQNGKIACSVYVYRGLDRTTDRTDESSTFTFYVSGFKLP